VKIVGEINGKIQSSSKFHQIIKGIIWNREIPKHCKRTVYKVYFIPISTLNNAKTWTLAKRNKIVIHPFSMKFLSLV
jgi:hypothetical protein